MPRSEAQKRADKKYIDSGKCKYKTIAARVHIDQAQAIDKAAEKLGISTSKFLTLAALYCVDHDVKF